MFRHVVMFKWNDDVDDAHVDATAAALDELTARMPEVRGYRHGRDLGLTEGNFDYVIVGEYESIDDYVTYRDHPDHRALIANYIAGRVSARAAVQYDAS
ncbi:MAG: Dabb family protein [Ilumatobacter sp.]|jgi:hypothetical protein|uniref:Dabb family protein n=1 Tax=Ilumatobacter sp. TaxID=1967498 RepID=UPI00391CF690